MNKQDKEKAEELAKEYGIDFPEAHSSAYPLCYKAAIEMADWKQEQMIQKAVEWLKKMIPSSNLERKIYNCFTEEQKHNLIEDFKKAMKGE